MDRRASRLRPTVISPVSTVKRGRRQPLLVRVSWRQLPSLNGEAEQVARDIAETVLGHIQRRLDAPTVMRGQSHGDRLLPSGRGGLAQAQEPLSYFASDERLVAAEWADPGGRRIRLISDHGRVIERETAVRTKRIGYVGRMGSPPRRPARVHIRPGRGGHPAGRRAEEDADPTGGVDAYGEVIWWAASAGAKLGLIEIDPSGNTVAWCRLSGDDGDETLMGQVRPILSLVNRNEELAARYILLAVDMSGTREVVLDRMSNGAAIRDDVAQIDRWIAEGWLEHVVLRDQRRLARDTLPGEQILRLLQRHRIGLWFADTGRRLDFLADRATLRFSNVIAAEDRDNLTLGTQLARINKGPLIGKGWGNVPFGFYRHRRSTYQDPEQWPFILRAFELADALGKDDPDQFSIRKVCGQLATEGCPFSSAHLGRLLRSRIYATGEWTVKVRGVEVAQEPIPLTNPVPLDRFQRVQEILSLRQGRSTTTNVGECLLNVVDAVHSRCAETESVGGQVRIKGYRESKLKTINYRHKGAPTPACCRSGGRNHLGGFTWNRDEIDPVLARAVRGLASHPEILHQAAEAARHSNANSSARLTGEQRAALEAESEIAAAQIERLADEWVERAMAANENIDLEAYLRVNRKLERKLSALRARLDNDVLTAEAEDAGRSSEQTSRVDSFLEIMTEETPTDPFLRQLRARLFQRIVSRVIIEDEGDGPINLVIEGHLVPEGSPLQLANPVLACAELLDAYEAKKNGKRATADAEMAAEVELRGEFETVSAEASAGTVSELYDRISSLKSGTALQALRRQTTEYRGWATRSRHRRATGVPSWRLKVGTGEVDCNEAPAA